MAVFCKIMDKWLFLAIICAVLLGWFSHSAASSISSEMPYSFTSVQERVSPSNHLKEKQIQVYDNFVVIQADNLFWAKFTDTNSMDPLIDKDTNSLEVKPKSSDDIKVGDIVSYSFYDSIIIHRVIRIGEDKSGWYAVAKGDNNPEPDPEFVRFSQINGVVIGILY